MGLPAYYSASLRLMYVMITPSPFFVNKNLYYSKEKQLPQKESMTELQEEQQKLDGIKERKVEDGRVVEKSQYEKEEHVEKWDDDKDTDQRK